MESGETKAGARDPKNTGNQLGRCFSSKMIRIVYGSGLAALAWANKASCLISEAGAKISVTSPVSIDESGVKPYVFHD